MQDFTVEKQQGAEGLILGGGGHAIINSQMRQESFDLLPPHGVKGRNLWK